MAWLSLVERSLWERDVAGSNPVAPTIPAFFTALLRPRVNRGSSGVVISDRTERGMRLNIVLIVIGVVLALGGLSLLAAS